MNVGKRVLSVIIPAFNEADSIQLTLRRVLDQQSVGQVIVIDDGSTDNTFINAKSITDSRLHLIQHHSNFGKGTAISTAIPLLEFPISVIQDADLEYDPSEFEKLINPILSDRADVVYGSRFLGFQERRVLYFWHFVANKFLTFLSNAFTNLNLSDMETCYKVVKTIHLKDITLNEKRFGVEPELTAKLSRKKLRFFEVPINYYGRTYEEGKKIRARDGLRALYCIVRYNIF
jgi:glycosyltransferase involved in cell wall biosynthesis